MNLSALDTARWNTVTAKASGVSAESLPSLLAYCREHSVGLLIARCLTSELAAAQAMERAGFQVMDTLVYFSRGLDDDVPPDQGMVAVREAASGEHRAVKEVARRAFAGYFGHYHADARLERRQCDELYVDWAERSCLSREVADTVLVAAHAGEIVAFATLRLNDQEEGEGVLFGVAPQAQGRGIYRALMTGAMRWFKARGRSRMLVSTQITNIAVQKVWTRLGFEPASSWHTFHKWF
ncbi:MAG TPA: GNAT family N-acetyltransferase [Burkholderiales bacterium]